MSQQNSANEIKAKGHEDPTHRMASPKVRYGFYIAVWALSAMIYYMVKFRYETEEAPKRQQRSETVGPEATPPVGTPPN